MSDVGELSLPGLDVSRETVCRLIHFAELVQRWNATVNLVSKDSVNAIWDRHVIDSAQLYSLAPPSAHLWGDLGSGGGFPALVVACIAAEKSPQRKHVLIEADKRKAAFLRQVILNLQLVAEVVCDRIEAASPLNADVVSARALAPLPRLLPLVKRHLHKDGTAILPKGKNHPGELADAQRSWDMDVELFSSLTDPAATILRLRNLEQKSSSEK